VRRSRRGGYELRLPKAERDVLRTLPSQLRSLLAEGDPTADPALRRLYPAAYLDDPESSAEFDGFVRDDLTAQRVTAVDTMERTIDAEVVTAEELAAWLGSINDLRLVLGVRLAVTEESTPQDFADDADDAASFALYAYLAYLEDEIVQALSKG
jgi:hypothetical protein